MRSARLNLLRCLPEVRSWCFQNHPGSRILERPQRVMHRDDHEMQMLGLGEVSLQFFDCSLWGRLPNAIDPLSCECWPGILTGTLSWCMLKKLFFVFSGSSLVDHKWKAMRESKMSSVFWMPINSCSKYFKSVPWSTASAATSSSVVLVLHETLLAWLGIQPITCTTYPL